MPTVVLRRRLFGFKPQQVHELLADRDFAVGRAMERAESMQRELEEARERLKTAERTVQEIQERASSAEERIQKLEADQASNREELAQKSGEVASLQQELSQIRATSEQLPGQSDQKGAAALPDQTVDPLLGMLVHGLAPIIDAAREAAGAMVAEATKISEQRIEEADGVIRALREQGRSMASWWDGVQGVFQPTLSTLEQARARMGEVPARVEQALAPVVHLMGTLTDQLGEFAAASEPPPFKSPLDDEGGILDLRGAHEGQGAGTGEASGQEAAAGTAVGLRASHAWWPEVSPSVSSSGG